MHRDENNSLRRFGMTIVALVGLVLLVACTNLANLVLARGAARQGELAVRMAMGASRARLVWEQCIESLLLAAGGAAASYVMFQVVAAMMTIDFNIGPLRALTIAIRPALDARAIAVAAVSTLLAILVFGLEPAIQLARTADIRSALAAGATGIRPRVGRQRMVIRWQVAIAAGFFIIATMFIRQTLNLAAHDSGVELDRIAVASLNFDNGVWNDDRIGRAIDRVLEEGRAEHGARSRVGIDGPAVRRAPEAPARRCDAGRSRGAHAAAIAGGGGDAGVFQSARHCDGARTRVH